MVINAVVTVKSK